MADIATGYTFASGTVVTPTKLNDAINLATIEAGAVTASKLASDAVETAKIKDANVTTAKIADSAVTVAKHDSTAAKGHAKAWISFVGSTGAVRGTAFNLSVSRTSTGLYRLTFDTAMADANYAVVVTTSATAGSASDIRQSLPIFYSATTPTTTYFEVLCGNAVSAGLADPAIVNVVVFGN